MEHVGVYLYGFIPAGSTTDLGEIEGVEGAGEVRIVDAGGALAVTGEVAVSAFESALSDGPDPAWLIPRALGHERVLGAILARSPVLPVRFGTLFSSPEALDRLVAVHVDSIAKYFATVGDQREWSLRGYVDAEAAESRVLELDPALAKRQASLPSTPGARYFQEKKLREDARVAARRMSASAAETVCKAIRSVVTEARSLPLRPPEGPGREMVLHQAALIPRGRELEVLAEAQAAVAEAGGLLSLEPSGPWPPFHFCPQLEEPGP